MVNYENYKVEDLKPMLRGIGLTSTEWPARKKGMVEKLQNWDKVHPQDIAANRQVGAGGLPRFQASTRPPVQAPVPAPAQVPTQAPAQATALAQPEESRKRKRSTPLPDAGARPKRQKKNESIDEPSDVENAPTTAKPTRIPKILLRNPSSTTGSNVPAPSFWFSTPDLHGNEDAVMTDTDEEHVARLPSTSSRHDLSVIPEEDEDEAEGVASSKTSTRDPQTHVTTAIKVDEKLAVSKTAKPSDKGQFKTASSAQSIAVPYGQTRSAGPSQTTRSKPTAIKSPPVQPVARKTRTGKMSKENSKDEQDRQSSSQPDGFELERRTARKFPGPLRGNRLGALRTTTSSKVDTEEDAMPEDSDGEQNTSDEDHIDDSGDSEDGEQETTGARVKQSSQKAAKAKSTKEAAGKNDKAPPAKETDEEKEARLHQLRPLGGYSNPAVAKVWRVRRRTVKLTLDDQVPPGTERAPMDQLGSWRRLERHLETEKAAGREVKLWMGGDFDDDDRERSPMEMAFPEPDSSK